MLKFGSKSDINVSYKCTVRLLEDTEVLECEFQANHKGKFLVEHVCKQLNLIEKDYFGLRYVDPTRQRHWLDPAKSVIKQVKEMDPILFSFRVKFYPPDPFRLKEEITRYQIYLQLKRDLLHGRLYCTSSEASLLAAYIIQSELGDYDPDEHEDNYVSEFKLLLKQTPEIEEKMMELHQTQLKGQTPAQMENAFLRKACQLDTYGVDPHPVKDHRANQLYLGINHCGILTFQGSRKTHHFRWNEVQKINYEGKMFIIHLTYNEKKHTVGFKCPTGAACRHVWRCAIEQMLFFTLPSSSDAPSVVSGGSFFSWGTKFRYSGRVEKEILEDIGPLRREEPSINRTMRSSSLRRKAASVPATPSTPIGAELGYGSLPRANHSAPASDGGLLSDTPLSSPYCPDNTLPLLETVSEDQEIAKYRNLAEEVDAFVNNERNGPLISNSATSLVESPQSQVVEAEVLTPHPAALVSVVNGELANGRAEEVDAFIKNEQNGPLISTGNSATNVVENPQSQVIQAEVLTHAASVPVGNGKLVNGEAGCKENDGHHTFDDYYFRDSFDHSSSESQLVDVGANKSHHHPASSLSHRSTPVIRTKLPLPAASPAHPPPAKRFNLLHVFVPSFLFVVLSLALLTITVLELDLELWSPVRQWPEMVTLRREYYEPAKEYFRQRISKLIS